MKEPFISVLISEEKLNERIAQLGEQISKDYEGKEVKRISREAWKFDPLFSRQDAYTILFDKAEEMEMEKDTSLHSVQVEWIYLKEKRVKRYYFERKKDAIRAVSKARKELHKEFARHR